MDIPGREGEGQRILELYVSGLVKFPTGIKNADTFKKCGDYFRQYLERYKPWVALARQVEGLTPYSLRHGFAWRGHKSYSRSIHVRDLAALMGHNPDNHHKYYGKWIDEDSLLESISLVAAKKAQTV